MTTKRKKSGKKGAAPSQLRAKARPFHLNVPTLPALVEDHEDERGRLAVIFSETAYKSRAGSVAVITSKKGTIRANHFHKRDSHFVYVVSGRMSYYERVAAPTTGALTQIWDIRPGGTVFTPPKVEHAMLFLEDTVLVVIGDRGRTQQDYEKDIVRVSSLVPAEDLAKVTS